MRFINRILFFFSLFIMYLIGRELIELYLLMKSVHPLLGYFSLMVILAALIYFVITPVIGILKIPINKGPATNIKHEPRLISERIQRFKFNEFLKNIEFDFHHTGDEKILYAAIIKKLEPECEKIRKKYVSQLFYTSSISQNGFIDAILILSSSISLIKEIFLLFNGRVSNKDLLAIGKRVYYSMAIGGSEGIEYATEELLSKLASDSLKSIPFLDKILGSLADGFLNAVLLTRVSYITENYCKMTYIQSERDLLPSPKFIANATKNITYDIIDRIFSTIRKIMLEKSLDVALVAVNPIGYVLTKAIDKITHDSNMDPRVKNGLKEGAMILGNPISYGIGKLIASLRR